MSKKRRTSLATMMAHRKEVERRWCYEKRIQRLTYRAIAEMSELPSEKGGLGYPLSWQTVCRRASDYAATLIEHESETREMMRYRELEALDAQDRALREILDPVDQMATRVTGTIVLRDDAARIKALAEIRRTSESRRKLLGLDAPAEANVTVVGPDIDALIASAAAELGL